VHKTSDSLIIDMFSDLPNTSQVVVASLRTGTMEETALVIRSPKIHYTVPHLGNKYQTFRLDHIKCSQFSACICICSSPYLTLPYLRGEWVLATQR